MTSAPALLRVWGNLRACSRAGSRACSPACSLTCSLLRSLPRSLTCSWACVLVCVLAGLLGGCAAGGAKLEAAEERLPIGVPCIAVRPAAPVLPAVPQHGIFEQVQALLAREHLRAAYVRQLEALMDGCAGS